MIVAIVVMVAIAGSMIYYFVFFRPGIESAKIKIQEAQQKQYEITTYDLSEKARLMLNLLISEPEAKRIWPYESAQEFLKNIMNGKAIGPEIVDNVKEGLTKNTYYATQIINYSDTEISFIEFGSNKELFILADYITILQTK